MFQLDALCFEPAFQFDRVMMREFAETPGAIVLLAEDSSPPRLVGFIIVHLEDAHHSGAEHHCYAYVITIDVASDHRRNGLGAALLHQAESISGSAGALHIGLHVAVNNTGAIQFYESQRYKRIGLAKRFYREAQQDALVFAKDL